MNDTVCDKQRYTGTARKRLYVHANTGCKRYKLHGMTKAQTATSTNTLSGFVRTLLD
ncbi:hypothetical protein T07_6715 [Trichinella nelsoni]|uniref:Uncharacterized protein n=1 Tax=Trichinella nelsoni TaxID=6336 RepID=A0A0V0SJF3_9BILA|nr:hypothetical protein T07_6715 [Trichinella nelsoni]